LREPVEKPVHSSFNAAGLNTVRYRVRSESESPATEKAKVTTSLGCQPEALTVRSKKQNSKCEDEVIAFPDNPLIL
jgi:hypothetical protein